MLTLVEGPFDESLLDTCWLAIAATDDDALNQRVSEAAEARRIFCNVVDAPKAASFIMPLSAFLAGGVAMRWLL